MHRPHIALVEHLKTGALDRRGHVRRDPAGGGPWLGPTSMPPLALAAKLSTNPDRYGAGSAADRVVASSRSVVASWFCSRAPTAALPTTEPTWRSVLFTPAAAPASIGGTPRMASVAIGAQMPPMPRPMIATAGQEADPARVGPGLQVSTARPRRTGSGRSSG